MENIRRNLKRLKAKVKEVRKKEQSEKLKGKELISKKQQLTKINYPGTSNEVSPCPKNLVLWFCCGNNYQGGFPWI
jgi:hypothetical protein